MKNLFLVVFIMVGLFLNAQTFTLISNDLGGQAAQSQVYNAFGCTGGNISPGLKWINVPEGTKSFAITVHDEDAPTPSGWWHWLVFDIPANVNEIKTGAGDITKNLMPEGAVQSITDFGSYGYGGPCPPVGDRPHKYTVTVYALKEEHLGMDKDTNPAFIGFLLEQNAIEKASVVFYSKR